MADITALARVGAKLIKKTYKDMSDGTFAEVVSSSLPGAISGNVGGYSTIITPAITTTASPAYSSGDVVGGKLTLTSAVRSSGGTAILQSVFVVDTTNQKQPLTILLFNADPTNGTYTDNGAVTVNATDAAMCIRKFNILASDYETVGGIAFATIPAIGKVVKPASGTSLYALIVTTGTPTYGANATSLYVRFGLLQD